MVDAVAIANNDVVLIVWRYPEKIPHCLGFAVQRKAGPPDGASEWVPLPAWVGFQGENNSAWVAKDTEIWPIQKFMWKDLTAQRGATYSYRIVPTAGQPGTGERLQLLEDEALTTAAVTLTPDRGQFKSYFNRGILSTQFLTHQIAAGPSGEPNYRILTNRIDQPGDPLRTELAGQILEGLQLLLRRAAAEGGSCYAALYELTDPEMVQLLLEANGLHLILSNTGTDDKENAPARQALHERGGREVIDRFVPSGHIGHNKFCVFVNAAGAAEAVLAGSTNWTDTAICAQSNNALIVENAEIAAAYLAYWKRLKDDTPAQGTSRQGPDLRESDMHAGATDVATDEGTTSVWFSPNTPKARVSRPGPDEAVPPDLAEVFDLMDHAEEAIIFLEFEPGTPSVVDHAAKIGNEKPHLFIRGAITDPKAVGVFNTTLIHRPGEDPVEVVAASAISDQFGYWQKELLKAGPEAHAIIHDKIVVIDPMSPNCVVITGSHNHGFRASYNNDENLLIIKGHTALAQAYAVHVMDVYDHYRFRYIIQKNGTNAFSGLVPSDAWQDKYFNADHPANDESDVWLPHA